MCILGRCGRYPVEQHPEEAVAADLFPRIAASRCHFGCRYYWPKCETVTLLRQHAREYGDGGTGRPQGPINGTYSDSEYKGKRR